MSRKIHYICGGRSFSIKGGFRKLDSVSQCWRDEGFDVTHVYGGDIINSNQTILEYGSDSFFKKWYRKSPLLNPLINSISEHRDIKHNLELKNHLAALSAQEKPNIIWERSSRLHCAGLDIAREIGVPFVLEWKDNLIPYTFSLHHRRAIKLEKRKNHEADFIVVESNVLKDHLSKEGVDPAKIIIAHNAVDVDQFSRNKEHRASFRQELGVLDDEVLVGYLGSYAFYHDATRLVLAANLLRQQGHEKIKILMVGAGKEFPRAQKVAKEHNLPGANFIMKPGVSPDAVPRILSALDIAVLPGSTDIICPIKIQEYMASELATIAPDYPCNREVVSQDTTGVLFEPKNEKSLADKILFLANNRLLSEEIGRRARLDVLDRFTWEKTWGAALQEIFKRVEPA